MTTPDVGYDADSTVFRLAAGALMWTGASRENRARRVEESVDHKQAGGASLDADRRAPPG
ncbi:MAG TPA: hypothetical protein H9881_13225 [Candidatus Stackebrandtia excrementipullorum]|nr:hypothetical protein [Candidatus Stackebrandtia excrementipullorum]